MILKDLLRGIRVMETIGSEETEISGVAIDSRKVTKGGLFVAMKVRKSMATSLFPRLSNWEPPPFSARTCLIIWKRELLM